MPPDTASPTPIAIAVIEHEGRFLIGPRPPGAPLAGLWEFPGGKVVAGESPEQAAVREALEETGLVVEALREYPRRTETYAHDRVRLHFFACRPADPAAVPRAPFRWVARGDLEQYAFPSGNRALLELLREHP